MDTYRSHKLVQAAKIVNAMEPINRPGAGAVLELQGEKQNQVVTVEWVRKHAPATDGDRASLTGGYLVVYEDGYTSWSPADVFERGYTKTTVVSDDELARLTGEHILQFFSWKHLPNALLQGISREFAVMAAHIMRRPRNPERTVALRKLLESKDAAVRAEIAGPMETSVLGPPGAQPRPSAAAAPPKDGIPQLSDQGGAANFRSESELKS